ncbi:hypothetical protein DFH11DRAFT_1623073 [Phellopilus nigrolimitatus]|nr:hypothetical protein DFH11DRAFT_1623073 [Phellopilus nigrolimitatus]
MTFLPEARDPSGKEKTYDTRIATFNDFADHLKSRTPSSVASHEEPTSYVMQGPQPTHPTTHYRAHHTYAQGGHYRYQGTDSPPQRSLPVPSGRDVPPAHINNNPYTYQSSLLPASNLLPSYALSNLRQSWSPQQACSSSSSQPQSPTLAQPCPRISRVKAPRRISQSFRPAAPPCPSSENFTTRTHNQYGFTTSSWPDAGSSNRNWQGSANGPNESSSLLYSSSNFRIESQSASPQSTYSDISEERPRQRRRTTHTFTTSMKSVSPVSGSSSDSSFVRSASPAKLRRNSKNTRAAKAGSSRDAHGKHPSSSKPFSSFSTFTVQPSPAVCEPAGVTYMSTVDFASDTSTVSHAFEHGPTELPPRAYIGGPDAISPWKPRKNLGTIPGSALDYLPIVETRMSRLEKALDAYVRHRGELAIRKSILPGMEPGSGSDDSMTAT